MCNSFYFPARCQAAGCIEQGVTGEGVRANDTIFGLAAGIWSRDVTNAMRVADRIEAGTVYINNYFSASAQSPVGGYKQSGYGRENGWEGMRSYMQTKSVWLSTDPSQPAPF